MTIRAIRYWGDPVLRTPCATIDKIDSNIETLVRDLLDTTDVKGRAGVAAPQIGVSLRAFSWNVDGKIGYILNPILVDTWGPKEEVDEGCLSVPGLWFPTPRYLGARVCGINLKGEEFSIEGEGLFGQMLQHETDHLDGIVYVQKLNEPHSSDALRQIRESEWFLS